MAWECSPLAPPPPSDSGESVVAQRPPGAGPTPDFSYLQHYLDAAPRGVGIRPLRDLLGAGQGRGAGVRVVDIEYSWNQSHEDLGKAAGALIPNQTPDDPFDDNNHGTAVLGEFIADANGFGVTGIVHGAQLGLVNASNAEDGSAS